MEKNLTIYYNERTKMQSYGAAISSPIRLAILKELNEKSMSVKELAFKLNIPVSSCSEHIKVLESADLIRTFYQAGKRGSLKLCALKYEKIIVEMTQADKLSKINQHIINMPIGAYFDCNIKPTCGMVDAEKFIEKDDDVAAFYSPDRFNAQLLWFKSGYIEYRFPLGERREVVRSIQLSLECCSEAPGYRNDFPSDITFSLNSKPICEWKCPGDFGGRRGALTPAWWPSNSTQYGLLKIIQITDKGSFLDDAKVSNISLKDLEIGKRDYLSFKIEVKETATNVGGVNIFGEKFGNHAQNIMLVVEYESL